MSASETQHSAIEQLMGHGALSKIVNTSTASNRDETSLESLITNHEICKSYIVAQCPYELFHGTKEYHGKCPQYHVSKYAVLFKTKFHDFANTNSGKNLGSLETSQKDLHVYLEFHKQYYQTLVGFIQKCNVTKEMAIEKLESKTEDERLKISEVSKELDNIDESIALLSREIEVLATNGELERSMAQSIYLSKLTIKREDVAKRVREFASKIATSGKQELQVCNVCGAYLSRLDNDKRLADHFLGKVHMNYVHMRSEISRLKTIFKKYKINPSSISSSIERRDTRSLSRRYMHQRNTTSLPSQSSTPITRAPGAGRYNSRYDRVQSSGSNFSSYPKRASRFQGNSNREYPSYQSSAGTPTQSTRPYPPARFDTRGYRSRRSRQDPPPPTY
ncbi:hypothetical protein ACO0RG_001291 [Hanseniaspora osmophila]